MSQTAVPDPNKPSMFFSGGNVQQVRGAAMGAAIRPVGGWLSDKFGGARVTSTESIRKRYKSTGFDPAAKIRSGLESSLKRVRGFADGSPKPSWRPTALLFLAGLFVLTFAAITSASGLFGPKTPGAIGLSVVLVLALCAGSVPGWIGALSGQGRVGGIAVATFLLGAAGEVG